jgi:iron complex outermembrane recepter protein
MSKTPISEITSLSDQAIDWVIKLNSGKASKQDSMLAGSFSFSALAESSPQTFKIPAQPLDDALTELADHAGMRLLNQADTVKNLHSNPVSGRLSPEQALHILLSDSGLNYRKTADNAITLEKLNSASNVNEMDATVNLGAVKVTATAEDDINSDSPYNTRYNRTNATTATKTDTPIMQTPVSIKMVPQQ